MAGMGRWLAGVSWPWQFVMLAGFVGIVFLIATPFKRIRPFRGQLMVLAAITWMGILFYLISFTFPGRSIFTGNMPPAYTIPRVWVYALIPTVILTLIPIVRGKNDPDPKWGNLKLVGIVLTLLVLNVGLFQYIGYYISSALFIVALMWLLGCRSKVELLAVPAGWVVFTYFVFAQLLNVRLPVGSLVTNLMGVFA
ncbi:MAG: tripartite tricarboxylate transporter TctB family protein [Defluviitaleaceae bacterium]|nr:tripartite tricarboxylate transporter TctB family protein [Defluviitaleaceae bacterium]